MNNRGFYSIGSILLWFFLIMLAVGIIYAQNHLDQNNLIESLQKLNWTDVYPRTNTTSVLHPVVTITYDFINFLGRSTFTLSKEALLFGYNHPQWNGELIVTLVILAVAAPIIYPLFTLIVSIILIISEWRKNRREKRQLEYAQR